jgi:glycosyltransferase involved in cell wall biosynthesis
VRILHVTDRLTDRGGAHWHLLGVIAEQKRRGHSPELAVGRCDPGLAPPCPVTIVPGLDARGREPAALGPVVGARRPNVVHVHTVVNPLALELAAGLPALVTVQDHRYFCPTRGKWTLDGRRCREAMRPDLCAGCFEDAAYFREVYALTAQRLAAVAQMEVVVLSEYMKGELAAAGVGSERLTVIPPFVHGLDETAPASGPPCVLFVGRLSEAKGAHEAARVWRLSGLEPPLVFAGTGPLRERLESEGFEVLGWVPHPQLASVYRRGLALVMPSLWQEPFGIAGLEAASLGVPVAAYASGGIPEWHPGVGLVDWGDADALAGALRAVVGRAPAPARVSAKEELMERLERRYAAVRR